MEEIHVIYITMSESSEKLLEQGRTSIDNINSEKPIVKPLTSEVPRDVITRNRHQPPLRRMLSPEERAKIKKAADRALAPDSEVRERMT